MDTCSRVTGRGCRCALEDGHTGPCSCKEMHVKTCPKKEHTIKARCEEIDETICSAPCSYVLNCGHVCPGACGECVAPSSWTGLSDAEHMIHRRCSRKCGKILPCGHGCMDGCYTACSPCRSPCNFTCSHGESCRGDHYCADCPRKCSEPCPWKCPHHQCQLLCCMPCTRPRCNERCSELLPCGHRCFGLCGEKCPRLCPECYKGAKGEEAAAEQRREAERVVVDMVVLMEEEEIDAYCKGEDTDDYTCRPLWLSCCNHYVPVGFMDGTIQGEKSTVLMYSCPFCGVTMPQDMIKRYGPEIKQMYNTVKEVLKLQRKERAAVREQNKKAMTRFINVLRLGFNAGDEELDHPIPKLEQYWSHWESRKTVESSGDTRRIQSWKEKGLSKEAELNTMFYQYISVFKSRTDFNIFSKWCLTAQMENASVVSTIAAGLNYLQLRPLPANSVPHMVLYTHKTLHQFWRYMMTTPMEDDVAKKFALTVEWLSCLYTVYICDVPRSHAVLTVEHKKFFGKLYLPLPERYHSMQVDIEKLENLVIRIGRPAKECFDQNLLRSLSKALDLSSGHWFRCPNGHLYAIGECGGAMQEAKCPECGATVGGTQHRVQETNYFAGDLIDESARPSYAQQQLKDVGNNQCTGIFSSEKRIQKEYRERKLITQITFEVCILLLYIIIGLGERGKPLINICEGEEVALANKIIPLAYGPFPANDDRNHWYDYSCDTKKKKKKKLRAGNNNNNINNTRKKNNTRSCSSNNLFDSYSARLDWLLLLWLLQLNRPALLLPSPLYLTSLAAVSYQRCRLQRTFALLLLVGFRYPKLLDPRKTSLRRVICKLTQFSSASIHFTYSAAHKRLPIFLVSFVLLAFVRCVCEREKENLKRQESALDVPGCYTFKILPPPLPVLLGITTSDADLHSFTHGPISSTRRRVLLILPFGRFFHTTLLSFHYAFCVFLLPTCFVDGTEGKKEQHTRRNIQADLAVLQPLFSIPQTERDYKLSGQYQLCPNCIPHPSPLTLNHSPLRYPFRGQSCVFVVRPVTPSPFRLSLITFPDLVEANISSRLFTRIFFVEFQEVNIEFLLVFLRFRPNLSTSCTYPLPSVHFERTSATTDILDRGLVCRVAVSLCSRCIRNESFTVFRVDSFWLIVLLFRASETRFTVLGEGSSVVSHHFLHFWFIFVVFDIYIYIYFFERHVHLQSACLSLSNRFGNYLFRITIQSKGKDNNNNKERSIRHPLVETPSLPFPFPSLFESTQSLLPRSLYSYTYTCITPLFPIYNLLSKATKAEENYYSTVEFTEKDCAASLPHLSTKRSSSPTQTETQTYRHTETPQQRMPTMPLAAMSPTTTSDSGLMTVSVPPSDGSSPMVSSTSPHAKPTTHPLPPPAASQVHGSQSHPLFTGNSERMSSTAGTTTSQGLGATSSSSTSSNAFVGPGTLTFSSASTSGFDVQGQSGTEYPSNSAAASCGGFATAPLHAHVDAANASSMLGAGSATTAFSLSSGIGLGLTRQCSQPIYVRPGSFSPPPATAPLPMGRRMVRLSGLPRGMTSSSLKDLLNDLGLLDDVGSTISLSPSPRGNRMVAYVCLPKPGDAVEKLHGSKIGDNTLEVAVVSSSDIKPTAANNSEDGGRAVMGRGASAGRPPASPNSGGPLTQAFSASYTPMVFRLRGLPFSSKNEDVYEFIRSVQGVQNVSVCRCPEGRCTGDAFVELASPESAAQLRQLHGKMMGPRYIEIIPSTPHDRTVIMRSAASKGRHHRAAANAAQPVLLAGRGGTLMTLTPGAQALPIYGAQTTATMLATPEYCAAVQQQQQQQQQREMAFSNHSSPQLTPMSSGVYAMEAYPGTASPPQGLYSHPSGVRQHGILFASAPAQASPSAMNPLPATVRISGLPLQFTEESVAQCLTGVRIAPEGVYMVINELGQPTGEAIVELQGPDAVEAALAHNNRRLNDAHVLRVQRSSIELQPHAVSPTFSFALPPSVAASAPPTHQQLHAVPGTAAFPFYTYTGGTTVQPAAPLPQGVTLLGNLPPHGAGQQQQQQMAAQNLLQAFTLPSHLTQ
eukprot:gene10580-7349_t